jgi:hypothetical protein
MGLDISFNGYDAIKKGLVYDDNDDETVYIHIPDEDFKTLAYVSGGMFYVTANKWGRIYAPLTKWLMDNDIKWDEIC